MSDQALRKALQILETYTDPGNANDVAEALRDAGLLRDAGAAPAASALATSSAESDLAALLRILDTDTWYMDTGPSGEGATSWVTIDGTAREVANDDVAVLARLLNFRSEGATS